MTTPVPDEIRKAAHDATDLPLGRYFKTSPYELVDLALDATAPLIRADERERIRQQPPVCPPGAPPNVLCMTCFRPLCRSCGACECPDNSESLCGPVIDMGYLSLPADVQAAIENPEDPADG